MIEDVMQDGDDLFRDFNMDEFSGDFFSELFNTDEDGINGLLPHSPSSCVDEAPPCEWIKEIENMLFEENSSQAADAGLEFPQESQPQPEGVRVSVDDEDLFQNIFVDDGFTVTENSSPQSQVSSEDTAAALDTDDKEEEACQKKRSYPSEAEAADQERNDDPISKKLKRQIRNRDAAVRSRERRKEYVKDLELKSKYLEGECIRLQRLLHYCSAENHALHLQLQDKAYAASRTKQESAVLLLESLLLGSLLWFLGMLSLFSPREMRLQLPASVLENVDSNQPKVVVDLVALRRAKSKSIGLGSLRLFFKRKRCKASRSRIKALNCDGAVLAVC